MSTDTIDIEFTFPALKEAQGRLDAKNKELHSIFVEAGPNYDMSKVKSISGDTAAKVEAIRTLNAEIDEITKERDGYLDTAKAARRAKAWSAGRESGSDDDRDGVADDRPGHVKQSAKTLGELFVGSQALKGWRRGMTGPAVSLDLELKTLMTTSAGFAPEATRTGTIIPFATRPIQVIDLVPQTTTSQNAIVYMEETTFTNNAAETAEGGTYPEAALAFTEQSSPVRKITVWLPVTDEQLEDVPQLRGYIDNRLRFMLRQRLDGQLLIGNGTPPNLRGLLNVGGIQTQAKGADPTPDAFYRAMTKVRVIGRAIPDLHILHPNDWQDIRLLRTADGIYIWGSPSESGPERMWGLPVAQTDAETENTGLTLDTSTTELATRRGIDVQISNSHGDHFVEGKQAIRADVRVAWTPYRPQAICSVTGI